MKKILFATSALIATAGMAAAEAEITFGGYGRFGLVYDDSASGDDKETRLEQRFRLNIGANTTTDAGVKFEGRFQLETNEDTDGGAAGNGPGAAGFAVSAGGFRLDVGHVSDVLDSGDVVDTFGAGIGLTALIEAENTFNDAIDANGFGEGDISQQTVKVRYTVGDFTVAASYTEENEFDDQDVNDVTGENLDDSDVAYYQIGASYDFGPVVFGAAYGERDDAAETDYWVANLSGSFGALDYSVLVADGDVLDDVAYSLTAVYAVSSSTDIIGLVAGGGDTTTVDKETAYGIGFKHKLGGGVSLRGGVGEDASGTTLADLGVRFDF